MYIYIHIYIYVYGYFNNYDYVVHQEYGDSNNTPANWVKPTGNTGENIQYYDPFFKPNIDHPDTNFEMY